MPKKSRKRTTFKRTKTRSKSKKKKSAFRRRIHYKGTSNKHWWRKYKHWKKNANKGVLLKHTIKCTIADLPKYIWPSAYQYMLAASAYVSVTNGQQVYKIFDDKFANFVKNATNAFIAQDDPSVYGSIDGDFSPCQQAVKLLAFNPALSEYQLGPKFLQYLNQYSYMKYVGIKFKWKPNKLLNASSYQQMQFDMKSAPNAQVQNQTIYDGTIYPSSTSWPTNYFGTFIPQSQHCILPDKSLSLPKFYFNVCFDKQQYIGQQMPLRMLSSYVSQEGIPPNENTNSTILKVANVFDTTDNSYYIKKRLKKYDMTKPFKFYVRPYETSFVF